jgi:hypothetical protein
MPRLYRLLLRLYPYDFRLWSAAEMTHTFAQSPTPLRELAGLIAGAAAEWFAKWTGDRDAHARALPDWRLMRPAGIPKEVWFGAPRDRCSSDT